MAHIPHSTNSKIHPWDKIRWSRFGWLIFRFSLYVKHYGIKAAFDKSIRFLRTAVHCSHTAGDSTCTFIDTTTNVFIPFDGTVSVIIPTYNAGPEFESLCHL